MSKKRMIDTRFWSDSFVVGLDHVERYLFLYLLTNEHTDICGTYELPLKVMARETGIDVEALERLLPRFGHRVIYVEGWVSLKNFVRHQGENESVKRGIERSLKAVPPEILSKIKQIQAACQQPASRVPAPASVPNLTKPNLTKPIGLSLAGPTSGVVEPREDEEIVKVMTAFRDTFNPTINYGNKNERLACKGLIKAHGLKKVLDVIDFAASVREEEFAPRVRKPTDLAAKWPNLQDFYLKLKRGNT